jgi:YVTN family beta-propeller protein
MRFLALAVLLSALTANDFVPPSGERRAARRPGAESVLPGGRVITPLGRQFSTGPGPFGLAVSPDGRMVVTSNGGRDRYSLTLLDRRSANWVVRQIETKTGKDREDEDDWRSVFMGLAFGGNTTLFAAEGNSGKVREIQLPRGNTRRIYDLNTGQWRDSYSGDIAFDQTRGLLYVVDQANFRVGVFDTRSGRLISSLPTGRLPFRLALSSDRRRLFVTNVGMYEYKAVPGADASNPRETGLPFPAYGVPSEDAQKGAQRQTARGPVDVPPLGDPNVPESNSLCAIDVTDPRQPRTLAFVPTGEPVGPRSVGGASPSGLAVSDTAVYVSNANQDTITVIDPVSLKPKASIPLRIPGLENYRGILPIGLALDERAERLYAAEAGINAVAVIDTRTNTLSAHLPAGWFPSAVVVHGGEILVTNVKGHGTGPNATRTGPLPVSFQADMRNGTLSVFAAPGTADYTALTARVMANNGFVPSGAEPASFPFGLRHVVLIVKENRTFDEVLGDVSEASNGPVVAAPELARFGRRGWVEPVPGGFRVRLTKKFYNITPNHHEIVRRYSFSDNFYCDSEVSVDGHHWVVGSYPNAWTESTLRAAYGGQKDFRFPTSAPGRLLFAESNSSVHPEEYLQDGALWHHLERHGISFRNFGEGFELAGVNEGPGLKPTGARYLTNVPMPDPLWRNTSRDYPQYNMNIPDQYRADQFIAEIDRLYVKQDRELPRFVFIHLPNDHLARPRPEDGYPLAASYMCDNDYALGRILEYLSKTRWWRSMAVIITEDDAQGGVDHIDSHRSLLLIASPYAKRNYVSRRNTSFPSILKTAFRILGIPPLNLFDATAADFSDCFTGVPNFAPFEALRPEPEIFVPENARDPKDPQPSPRMDDPEFLRQQHRRP